MPSVLLADYLYKKITAAETLAAYINGCWGMCKFGYAVETTAITITTAIVVNGITAKDNFCVSAAISSGSIKAVFKPFTKPVHVYQQMSHPAEL